MRKLRLLGQGVWYEIRTRINNREPLFRRHDAVALFARVFRQAEGRYEFVVRSLYVEDDWLTFYILPVDGFQLPEIMKWLKQVFAQRFNVQDGRIGHVWGDRYGSEIVAGEPPEEKEAGTEEERNPGVRPQYRENSATTGFLPFSPFPGIAAPG
jgi:hypothetical protein